MSNNHLNVENFHATAAVPGPSLANRPPALVIPGICEPNKRYEATRKMLKVRANAFFNFSSFIFSHFVVWISSFHVDFLNLVCDFSFCPY
ncbi:hypothetical protein ANCCAN_10702 [Ancylostoma caninum]|uniref:Uncharacterized protein n=1 Tax=Ancylostoma caninum TaxID=29170 RepID=A0A368GHX2_ANCCA|nr:hypothetical protein ANCCAN_10702 [Ancylostoma caninum]